MLETQREKIRSRVSALVVSGFPSIAERFDPKVSLQNLGLDSLDLVDLVFSIEAEFQVKFDNDELLQISFIEDLVNLIYEKSRR